VYITKQINQNECGVCVLATLVHHFYRKEVKNQLLNEANITNTGLSIFDLESLGVKYGIHFDSYQMSFDELLAMKNDGLLVIIVSKNSALHYTIIKKTKNSIEMYDSVSGKTIVKQNELKEVFQNVVLIPSKQLCKITLNNDCINIAPHFNFKYVAICIGIQLVVIVSSILGANYISEVIEKSLLIGSYKNLLILSFAFGLMFLLETLGTYVSKLFIGTHNMNISKILSSKFIDTLKYKNNDFLNKCDKNYFYLIDNAIQNIANFHSFQTIQFIASLICSVCLIIVLTAINFWYFLICAVGVILLSVCTYVHYHSSKIILRKTISNASINNGVSAECINYITQSHNIYALNKITSDLKNNYYEFSNIQKHGNFINSTLQFFIATIQKVLFIVVAGFSVYHILVNGQNLGMSKMILAITLINLF
jgi:ABC-type bacteriocin/lantibiotic exporter with double-glycine peptidase domain